MATNPPPPMRPYDDGYLHAYSDEHVAYEFDMFLWLAQLIASKMGLTAPSPADAKRLNNALVQAFVVNLRNVIDFLYLQKPQPTDVVAADFSPAGAWQPRLSHTVDVARTRAKGDARAGHSLRLVQHQAG